MPSTPSAEVDPKLLVEVPSGIDEEDLPGLAPIHVRSRCTRCCAVPAVSVRDPLHS